MNKHIVPAPATLQEWRGVYEWVIIRCPFCGKRHTHGGGQVSGDPYELLGHRVPHCLTKHDHDYELVAVPSNLSRDELDRRFPMYRDPSEYSGAEGYVYLIRSVDKYKIGISKSVTRRLSQLRMSNPHEVTLVHAVRRVDYIDLEKHLHRSLVDHRTRGEWFSLTQEQVTDVIATMNQGITPWPA